MLPPIFIAQLRTTVGALSLNRESIARQIALAKKAGAKFVVTPELAITGYPPLDLLLLPEFLEETQKEIDRLIPGNKRDHPFSRCTKAKSFRIRKTAFK